MGFLGFQMFGFEPVIGNRFPMIEGPKEITKAEGTYRRPLTDFVERDKNFILTAELPGVEKNHIDALLAVNKYYADNHCSVKIIDKEHQYLYPFHIFNDDEGNISCVRFVCDGCYLSEQQRDMLDLHAKGKFRYDIKVSFELVDEDRWKEDPLYTPKFRIVLLNFKVLKLPPLNIRTLTLKYMMKQNAKKYKKK